jgi:hypothetical protein
VISISELAQSFCEANKLGFHCISLIKETVIKGIIARQGKQTIAVGEHPTLRSMSQNSGSKEVVVYKKE